MSFSTKKHGIFKMYAHKNPERSINQRLHGKTVLQHGKESITWLRRKRGLAHGRLEILPHRDGYAFFHNGARLFYVGGGKGWQKAPPVIPVERIDEDYVYDS